MRVTNDKQKILKDNNAITLIALVITIIILLILAGISISALTQTGLFGKAKESREKYNSKAAEEKLQMALMEISTDKQTEKDYNENEYLTNELEKKGFIVNDNIIVVDGYSFEIDRTKLEIIESKGENKNSVILTYSVYDNQDINNLKLKLKFYSEKGIKSIEKPNGEKIDGENKKEVIIDYVIGRDSNAKFKDILSDNSEVESDLTITENGINQTFRINENTEENGLANIKVEYDYKENTDKTYYKIGQNGKWYEYTDNIQLDMAAIENTTDTSGNKGTSLIYIKKEDTNGNIVTVTKQAKINSTTYNVLSNIRYKGEDPDKYFTKVVDSNQFDEGLLVDNYLIPFFGYGHWQGSGSYNSMYKLNYSKLGLKSANKVNIVFNHYRYSSSDAVNTYAQVYYTDGTASEREESKFVSNEIWTFYAAIETRTDVTIDLDINKTVDYIEIKIDGYDSNGGDFYGIIRDINFYGVSK